MVPDVSYYANYLLKGAVRSFTHTLISFFVWPVSSTEVVFLPSQDSRPRVTGSLWEVLFADSVVLSVTQRKSSKSSLAMHMIRAQTVSIRDHSFVGAMVVFTLRSA